VSRLAMIAGGALGNLMDRMRDGAVTDFVRWHHEHLWPIFNVADVVLVIGVALLMLEGVLARRRPATAGMSVRVGSAGGRCWMSAGRRLPGSTRAVVVVPAATAARCGHRLDDSGTNLDGSRVPGLRIYGNRRWLLDDGCGDLTVTLGTRLATTNADGTFTIETPSGSNLVWHASGAGIVTSAMPFAAELVIPAISIDDYSDLLISNGVLLAPGQGSIVARVVRGTAAVADAIASVNPAPQFPPFYDGSSATVWDRDSTGELGTIWITGAALGATSVRSRMFQHASPGPGDHVRSIDLP
jgi:hypothetical protein